MEILFFEPQKENISTYFLPLASISYKPNRDSKKSDYKNSFLFYPHAFTRVKFNMDD